MDPINVDDDLYNLFKNTCGDNAFYPPTSEDYNPQDKPDFFKSDEDISFGVDHLGYAMARKLASLDSNGDLAWNSASDKYIADFKQLSEVNGYSLKPVTMLRCGEANTLVFANPPPGYPVTFLVNKFVGQDENGEPSFELVKYLQYTNIGFCHYSPK